MAVWAILLLCVEVFSVSTALDRRDNIKELLSLYSKYAWPSSSPCSPREMKCPRDKCFKIPKDWRCQGSLKEKILGGQHTKRETYPWFVSIEKNEIKHCGGMVIDSQWILTAAHCFDEIPTSENENQNIETHCMNLDTTQTKDKYKISIYNGKKIGIDRVRFHILYDGKAKGDLAFARLKRNLSLGQYKTCKICLKFFNPASIQDNCIIMGYGSTELQNNQPSTDLNRINIQLGECVTDFDDPAATQRNLLCSKKPFHAFHGDSGGPVICKDGNSNRYYLAGIIKSYYSNFNVFTGFQDTSSYLCSLLEFLQINTSEKNSECHSVTDYGQSKKKHMMNLLH